MILSKYIKKLNHYKINGRLKTQSGFQTTFHLFT